MEDRRKTRKNRGKQNKKLTSKHILCARQCLKNLMYVSLFLKQSKVVWMNGLSFVCEES